MVLLENRLFNILSFEAENGSQIACKIRLNKEDSIYTGHFPQHPVTPGVTMIQMMLEIIQKHLDRNVRLKEGQMIKFVHILDPNVNEIVTFKIKLNATEGIDIITECEIVNETTVFFKFKGLIT